MEAQSGKKEFDHATGVVPGVLVRADAEVADAGDPDIARAYLGG